MKQTKKKWKKLKAAVLVLVLLTTAGLYVSNKYAKRNGYTSIFEVADIYWEQSKLAKSVTPIELNIDISKADYEFIKQKREIAINRGLQINIGDNYVPCKLEIDGKTVEGEIRLKGHMTDHLQGDKWSFRIKSDEPVMGMYRFSIQHPGTRNYVYEWIYHQLLKQEGVIYLDYNFIDVNLNGSSLGIYAVEEHFGQHILAHNDRPKGAILRWNPNLYWEWRIDEFQKVYLDEAYSHYASSFAEPYDKGVVKKDSALIRNYQTCAYLLEAFRRGDLKTSEVFDIEKMARFHVIIDLVGGYHSLDWSDVKFYYNSNTKKVEPVGYESFSIRKTERIAGQRLQKKYDENAFNYHDQLFADPVFFEAYIQNLERIVDEAYLNAFFASISTGLNEKIALIAKEWPHRKFTTSGYYENVRLIRNNISLPKPFHAFLENHSDSTIHISVSPVSDYPIQIIGLKRKDKVHYLQEVINLKAKARATYTHYFDYEIAHPFKKSNKIMLLAKIPGGSAVFEVELNAYPSYKRIDSELNFDTTTLKIDTSMMVQKDAHVWFKNKSVTIHENVIIPKSYTLMVYPGQSIEFAGATLYVSGNCQLAGVADGGEISISSQAGGQIKLEQARLVASHVLFSEKIKINANESHLTFKGCKIYDTEGTFITDHRSDIVFYHSHTGNVESLGTFNESTLSVEGSEFNNGAALLSANGGLIALTDCSVKGYQRVADLDYSSQFGAWRSNFQSNDTIVILKKASTFNTYSSHISNSHLGVLIQQDSLYLGAAVYQFYKTTQKEIKQLEKII